jgi:hypothetical protein
LRSVHDQPECLRIRRIWLLIGLFGYLLIPACAAGAPLPDNRAYELVSPVEKPGTTAGANLAGEPKYGIASAEVDPGEGSNRFLYGTTGPVEGATSGNQVYAVAERSISGWGSHDPVPRELGAQLPNDPDQLLPSSDLSSLAFTAEGIFVAGSESRPMAYLSVSGDPAVLLSQPDVGLPLFSHDYPHLAGASATLDPIYFAYPGILVTEDEARRPTVEGGSEAWGFYESTRGKLVSAGELPNGSYSPYGAVPAATERGEFSSSYLDNQVSEDGSRALFVSPDPQSEHPSTEPPELYVREPGPDGPQSVLVSESKLTHSPAEPGPLPIHSADLSNGLESSYAYASPDGTHVFFASEARLTEAAPSDNSVKEYVFDTQDGALHYLPGVSAPILASSKDGTRIMFEDTASAPFALKVAEVQEGQGEAVELTVNEVSSLPAPTTGPEEGLVNIAAPRANADGSVFVFQTDSELGQAGAFNNAGGFNQIYRYAAENHEPSGLSCISCPPAGVTPTGGASEKAFLANGAHLSNDGYYEHGAVASRGLSSEDGHERIFFDSPDPLVPQDVNAQRDVYEWEDGSVQLISSGAGSGESFFLDSSPSGKDVFFSTVDSLVEADTDGAYDVYDAREGGGFPAPAPTGCAGECQGPPSAPPVLPAPLTLTSGPSGNLPPAAPATPKAKPKKAKKAKKAKHQGKTAKRPKQGKAKTSRSSATHRAKGTRSNNAVKPVGGGR